MSVCVAILTTLPVKSAAKRKTTAATTKTKKRSKKGAASVATGTQPKNMAATATKSKPKRRKPAAKNTGGKGRKKSRAAKRVRKSHKVRGLEVEVEDLDYKLDEGLVKRRSKLTEQRRKCARNLAKLLIVALLHAHIYFSKHAMS